VQLDQHFSREALSKRKEGKTDAGTKLIPLVSSKTRRPARRIKLSSEAAVPMEVKKREGKVVPVLN
jgi:hypothetical protein